MVNGSCLCGAVEYEVELIPGKVCNCHGSLCRKSHGAAFATQAFAKAETLRFLKGEELLSEYQRLTGVFFLRVSLHLRGCPGNLD